MTTFDEPPKLKEQSSRSEPEVRFHVCSACGLKLPISISNCPDDGTNLVGALGERLSEQYDLIEEIGSGGIGFVYKARHRLLNQTVAIKTLRSGSMDSASQKRFEQEAKLVSLLDHPGIVHIRDFGTTDSGQLQMVLDYVAGQSLSQALNWQGALSVEDSLEIVIQVCEAMAYAHNKDIIHRDIKPSNIMFTRSATRMQVKILDFGIAKLLNHGASASAALTKTGDIFGSPLYMSPEQAAGKKVDARSDIYSLGIVLYEIISGSAPFAGMNPFDIINRQMTEEVPSLRLSVKTIPAQLEAVVAKAVAKKPDDRFQSMAEFKRALVDVKMGRKNLSLEKFDENQMGKHQAEKFEHKVIIASVAITIASLGLLAYILFRQELNNPADKPLSTISAISDADQVIHLEGTATDEKAKLIIEAHKDDKKIDLNNLQVLDAGLLPFQKCTQAEEIGLRLAKLKGPGLAYLIHLPLRKLDLYGSAVTDRGLYEIKNMKLLRELNLSHTDVNNSGLKYLSDLPELRRLSLKELTTNDDGVDALAKIKNLQCLNLKYNSYITSKGMEKLASMASLRELRIRKSAMGDEQFAGLKSSKHLAILDISQNTKVDDKTIPNLLKTNIEELNLSNTEVTDKGIAMLAQMPSLKFLCINGKNISKHAIALLLHNRHDLKLKTRTSEDIDSF